MDLAACLVMWAVRNGKFGEIAGPPMDKPEILSGP
jgi:hypothetical protein